MRYSFTRGLSGFRDPKCRKGRRPVGRTLGSCAPRAHFPWIRVCTSAISTLMMGIRETACTGTQQREEQEWVKTSCCSWPKFVIQLSLPSLYLASTARPSISSRGSVHLPSPKWGKRGGKETYKKHKGIRRHKPFTNICSGVSPLPCPQTIRERLEFSGARTVGPKVPAAENWIP